MVLRKREKCVKIKSSFQNKKLININLGFQKLTPDVKPRDVSRHPRATQNANDKHKKKYKKEKSFANAKPFLF